MNSPPRGTIYLPGIAVFSALLYLVGRSTFLAQDTALPPIPGWWKLSFTFDPFTLIFLIVLAALATLPMIIVRGHAAGGWAMLVLSFMASLPIFLMVTEWAGKAIASNSDYGYLEGFMLASLLGYLMVAFLAALWRIFARRKLP